MVNMADCIARAIDFGEMDRARGLEAIDQYNQLVKRYETIMGPDEAARRAAADLKKATKEAVAARRHKVLNQLQAMKRLRHKIETAPDPAAALRNLLEYAEGSGWDGESVRSVQASIDATIRASLSEVLEKTGLNMRGKSRDAQLLEQVVQELHGQNSGDAYAGTLAEAVRTTYQRMRRMLNALGANIGELADYGLPHSHDVAKLRAAGFETWAQAIAPRLAWDRIPDLTTGQPFASAPGQIPPRAERDRFLREVYDGIITRGWNDRDPAMTIGGKALYAQRAEHRVLHFRDGSAWLDYNKQFGTSDPFTAMINGLHGMARDAALMRVLGPNPRMGLEFAAQVAEKRAELSGNPKLIARVEKAAKTAKVWLAHVDGSVNVPQDIGMARFFSGARSVLVSAQLGSAVLSSVADVGTISMAAFHMGMNPVNVLGRSVQLMASHATRKTAARMGFVAETMTDVAGGSARYFGGIFNSGLPDRLAGFTMRASGLSFLTDMHKISVQMEFAGELAEHAAQPFHTLPASLQRIMRNRGITSTDWDLLRDPAVRFRASNGADFISPIWWLEHQTTLPRVEAEGLAMRMQSVFHEQVQIAVPSATIEARAMLTSDAAPGNIAGELIRSFSMYKNYSFSLLLGQYRRFKETEGISNKMIYAGGLGAMMLIFGAVSIQLREIAKGNDPRPMNTLEFWMAAALQSGGLGILGDFFSASTSRTGGGFAEVASGPVVGLIGDAGRAVVPNVGALINGEETHFGRDLVRFGGRATPVVSSLWYTRAAYNRWVIDPLSRFLDPEAERGWQRKVRQMQKDFGTQPYWEPGEVLPSRAPDLGNALRQNP